MFAKFIESEIKWCEENKSAMPEEFSKGFISGLKQAVYIINAAKMRMVWQDGDMVDVEDLQTRADELSRAPVHAEQKCPNCNGSATGATEGGGWICSVCNGTGISNRSAGG